MDYLSRGSVTRVVSRALERITYILYIPTFSFSPLCIIYLIFSPSLSIDSTGYSYPCQSTDDSFGSTGRFF